MFITAALVIEARADTYNKDKQGPVYIHIPKDRDPKAGVVIYVHGHRSDKTTDWYVDSVMKKHDLIRKFEASGSKAAFVVVATWDGKGRGVSWPDLGELVVHLRGTLGSIPYVHAIGHSGAWKNLGYWASSPHLDHLTLLDSTYGRLKAFRNFGKRGRLDIVVGKWGKPRSNSKVILKGLKFCKVALSVVSTSECPVVFVEERVRHSNWAIDDHMIEFMKRGAALRATD
jgi:hypothetical protein